MNGVNSMLRPLYAKRLSKSPELIEIRRVLTEKAMSFCKCLVLDGNDDRMARYQTARAYKSLSILYSTIGDRSKDLEARTKVVALFESLTKDNPNEASFWNQLGGSHYGLAVFSLEMNEPTKAAEHTRMAADAYEQACLLDPNDHRYPNNLATVLVTSPDPTDRNNPKAVEFARRARDLEPGIKDTWNFLGAALYYAEDWRAAVEALESSLKLKPKTLAYRAGSDDCFCRFFLAMAQWKLNNKTQARQNYDLAVKWINENVPDWYDALRFRNQAAEVLGIKDSPQSSGETDKDGR
jgi:tetratricopeptide (TPR) repeat protein